MEILLYLICSLVGVVIGAFVIMLGILTMPGSDTADLSVKIIHHVLLCVGIALILYSGYSIIIYGYASIMLLI